MSRSTRHAAKSEPMEKEHEPKVNKNVSRGADLFKQEQKTLDPKMSVKAITEKWNSLDDADKEVYNKKFEVVEKEGNSSETEEVKSEPKQNKRKKGAAAVEEPVEKEVSDETKVSDKPAAKSKSKKSAAASAAATEEPQEQPEEEQGEQKPSSDSKEEKKVPSDKECDKGAADLFKQDQKAANSKTTVKTITELWKNLSPEDREPYKQRFIAAHGAKEEGGSDADKVAEEGEKGVEEQKGGEATLGAAKSSSSSNIQDFLVNPTPPDSISATADRASAVMETDQEQQQPAVNSQPAADTPAEPAVVSQEDKKSGNGKKEPVAKKAKKNSKADKQALENAAAEQGVSSSQTTDAKSLSQSGVLSQQDKSGAAEAGESRE